VFRVSLRAGCAACAALEEALQKSGALAPEHRALVQVARSKGSETSESGGTGDERRDKRGKGAERDGDGDGQDAHHVATVEWPERLGLELATRSSGAGQTVLDARALRRALQSPKPRKPLPHQARDLALIDAVIRSRTSRGAAQRIVVKYKMGSGKTALAGLFLMLTSVPPAERERVVVVCPNTLIDMWVSELQHFCAQLPGTTSEVHVVGYTEFHRLVVANAACVAGATVIVDEAHVFRNLTVSMLADVDALLRAARLVLLTGTPVVNDSAETHGLLALVGKETPVAAKAAGDAGTPVPLAALARALRDPDVLVLDYDPRTDPALAPRFPKTERRVERVEMSWQDVLAYLMRCKKDTTLGHVTVCTSNTNAYRVASRTGCNTASKVARVVDFIEGLAAARRLPAMVYSNFREKGLDLVAAELRARAPHLRVAELNGDTPGSARQKMINAANAGMVDVQLISEAAGVGTNFCGGFHAIVLLEALENVQTQEQVENRVVRLDAAPTLLALGLAGAERGEAGEDSGDEAEGAGAGAGAGAEAGTGAATGAKKKSRGQSKTVARDAETITLVQMLSTFPSKPPSAAEARALSETFAKLVQDHGVDVAAELQKFVRTERETVDERMMRQNAAKHKDVEQVLAVLKSVADATRAALSPAVPAASAVAAAPAAATSAKAKAKGDAKTKTVTKTATKTATKATTKATTKANEQVAPVSWLPPLVAAPPPVPWRKTGARSPARARR
jgi:hypothetical protein